jgi:N-acetylmuramoyl-L-alanine amidase.
MNLITCIMRNSVCYRGTTTAKPVGIVWHDTGAGNPNICRYVQPDPDDPKRSELLKKIGRNENGNDWNHPDTEDKGVNAFIGKLADGSIATVQTLPWNYRAWGVAGGWNGSLNGTTDGKMWIQFEICDDGYRSKDYFQKVYQEAVEFTAYLCRLYGIDPMGSVTYNGVKVPTVLCHQDAYRLGFGSNHGDVLDWFGKFGATMAQVRKDVNLRMEDDMTREETQKLIAARKPTRAEIMEATGDQWIETFEDLPPWAQPEVRELIMMGALKGVKAGETVEKTEIRASLNTYIRPILVAYRAAKKLNEQAPKEALAAQMERVAAFLRGDGE